MYIQVGEWKKAGDRNEKRTGTHADQKSIGLEKDYIAIELWSESRILSLLNWHNDNATMRVSTLTTCITPQIVQPDLRLFSVPNLC